MDERITHIEFTDDSMIVSIMDGRQISVPLDWYPRLAHATQEQQQQWEIIGGGYGMHWEEIDEDLHIEGLLRGAPTPRFNSAPQDRT